MTSENDKQNIDYHRFVFRDGKLLGDFENMYRSSTEVPWHQDQSAYDMMAGIDMQILRAGRYGSVCEIGCGLGFFTERLLRELLTPDGSGSPEVSGYDVSETALEEAARREPRIRYVKSDILDDNFVAEKKFELIVLKNVMWYVCHKMDTLLNNLSGICCQGGKIFISQAFPESETWVGKEFIACPEDIIRMLSRISDIEYYCVEYDKALNNRPYLHILSKINS